MNSSSISYTYVCIEKVSFFPSKITRAWAVAKLLKCLSIVPSIAIKFGSYLFSSWSMSFECLMVLFEFHCFRDEGNSLLRPLCHGLGMIVELQPQENGWRVCLKKRKKCISLYQSQSYWRMTHCLEWTWDERFFTNVSPCSLELRAMTTDETPTIEIAFANFNKMASKNVLATSDVSYSCHRLGKSRKQKATKDRERGVSFYKSQGHCKWSFCYIPSSSFYLL